MTQQNYDYGDALALDGIDSLNIHMRITDKGCVNLLAHFNVAFYSL